MCTPPLVFTYAILMLDGNAMCVELCSSTFGHISQHFTPICVAALALSEPPYLCEAFGIGWQRDSTCSFRACRGALPQYDTRGPLYVSNRVPNACNLHLIFAFRNNVGTSISLSQTTRVLVNMDDVIRRFSNPELLFCAPEGGFAPRKPLASRKSSKPNP